MKLFDFWDAVLIGLISLHLKVTPYSGSSNGLEEHFNTQAIYDFINHGSNNISQFDHLQCPGVPEPTFIGCGFYGYLTKLLSQFLKPQATQFHLQLLVRSLLGLSNAIGFIYLRHSMIYIEELANNNPINYSSPLRKEDDEVERKEEDKIEEMVEPKNSYTGLLFALFQYSQFEYVHNSSRFLPAFIALPLTNIAFGNALRSNYPFAFFLLGFTGIALEIEILLLMAILFLTSVLIFRKAPFWSSLSASLLGLSIGGLSVLILNTALWKPDGFTSFSHLLFFSTIEIIPEVPRFIYNVFHKQVSNWGNEPFKNYFMTFSMKFLLEPTIYSLLFIGSVRDSTIQLDGFKVLRSTSFLHTLITSFHSYKVSKFTVNASPLLALSLSSTIIEIVKSFKKKLFGKIVVILIVLASLIQFILSLFTLYMHRLHYPGGNSISYFHNYFIDRLNNGSLSNNSTYSVHLAGLAKTTGISSFEELQPEFLSNNYNVTLIYDRSESKDLDLDEFEFLIRTSVPKNHDNIQWIKIMSYRYAMTYDIDNFLMIENKFDPLSIYVNLGKEIYSQGNLKPLKEFIDNGIVTITLARIYEKHYLL